MSTVEKIIQLIKKDKEIAENLFLFSEFRQDVSLSSSSEKPLPLGGGCKR